MLGYNSYSPIKDIETGVTLLKKPVAKLLELVVGIREEWLFLGIEPMVKNVGTKEREEQGFRGEAQPIGQIRKVPLISWVKAGEWQEAVDLFQPGYADEWVDADEKTGPNTFALIVDGNSMEPKFADGDTIIVDPSVNPINGSYVIAKNGDKATFKKLVLDGSSVFLEPLNNKYPLKDMTGIEFRIIGVVVKKERRYR